AIMAANVPAICEAHFGVPMAGAVLNTINNRLDADTLAFILDHGEAKVLLSDREFAPVVAAALGKCKAKPLVIDIDDAAIGQGDFLGEMEYEAFLATGNADFDWAPPADEWDAISLNYTSGTTGEPKGVVYHHRGAYLNGLGNAISWNMGHHPVYLWTLPMFHCNGWCFPWAVGALAGTNICLRKVEAGGIYAAFAERTDLARRRDDPLVSQRTGERVIGFVVGGVEDYLRDALAVAQVDKDNPPVIAVAAHPPAQANVRAHVGRPQRTAVVRPFQCGVK
ncbi:hypothetical protein LCGC14_2980560, partial [marine sediment metagenome]